MLSYTSVGVSSCSTVVSIIGQHIQGHEQGLLPLHTMQHNAYGLQKHKDKCRFIYVYIIFN